MILGAFLLFFQHKALRVSKTGGAQGALAAKHLLPIEKSWKKTLLTAEKRSV